MESSPYYCLPSGLLSAIWVWTVGFAVEDPAKIKYDRLLLNDKPYATARSLSLCSQSSGTLLVAMISSAQIGDRYVGGPTRKLIR